MSPAAADMSHNSTDPTDQGTTFSSVAFAFTTNNKVKVDVITQWPGAGSYTKKK